MDLINGVTLTPLKIIPNPKGNILHALKASESSYTGFGEAYFSLIYRSEIKGWKRHQHMVLNLVVPLGNIRFVLYDERKESKTFGKFTDVIIGSDQFSRLTVPPMIWMAFQGIGEEPNVLLNIASIEHDPGEAETKAVDEIDFIWE